MFVVQIDGSGGSYFDTREEAERELRLWGFRPSSYLGHEFDKLLFTGRRCELMTARIEEVA